MARQAATRDRGELPRGTEREQRTRHTDETTPYTTPAARRERGTGEVIAKFSPKSRPPVKFKTTRADHSPATARDWHPDDSGKARHRQHRYPPHKLRVRCTRESAPTAPPCPKLLHPTYPRETETHPFTMIDRALRDYDILNTVIDLNSAELR